LIVAEAVEVANGDVPQTRPGELDRRESQMSVGRLTCEIASNNRPVFASGTAPAVGKLVIENSGLKREQGSYRTQKRGSSNARNTDQRAAPRA
jgi:hypothetical protein